LIAQKKGQKLIAEIKGGEQYITTSTIKKLKRKASVMRGKPLLCSP